MPAPAPPQVISMFMPRVNLERRAAWYKDGEPDAMSPVDAQVCGWVDGHVYGYLGHGGLLGRLAGSTVGAGRECWVEGAASTSVG